MEACANDGKYSRELLLKAFRIAALARDEMLVAGFTDNGGAIHSATRILDILGQRLRYPGLKHLKDLRFYPDAEFSAAARKAHDAGGRVEIEHVAPQRALTAQAIELARSASDEELTAFIRENYRLVLLTPAERAALDGCLKGRRTRISPDRLNCIKF